MKKVLKNVIICISILYFVISLAYTVIEKGIYEEELTILNSGESIMDEISNQTYETKDFISENLRTSMSMIDNNIRIFIISLIIGGMIGLIISVKENSKIKYILYFILGEVLYNTIWTAIMVMLYWKNGIDMEYIYYKLSSICYEMFTKTFLSYILIYISIIAINIANNKRKVKQLNENLLGEKEATIEDKKKKEIISKTIRAAVVIIILIISVYFINIVKNTMILTNYSNAVFEINKLDNYYYKEKSVYNEEGKEPKYGETEIYCKDGIYVTKSNNEVVRYENKLNKEDISINQTNKKAYISKKVFHNKIDNLYYFDNNVRKWKNFLLAFQVKVDSEILNDRKCYVIKRDNTTLYIDKETYLPIKEIIIQSYRSSNGQSQFEMIKECSYDKNVVTEQDIIKPDLTGYEIIEIDNEIHTIEK